MITPPAAASPPRGPSKYVAVIAPGGPVTQEEYNERIVCSEGAHEVQVPLPEGGHYTLRYAYVTQRGYYPGQPNKANQDALCVHTNFGGNADEHVFAVFDGHGELGTECALFAKDKVPKNLLKDPRLSSDHASAYTR